MMRFLSSRLLRHAALSMACALPAWPVFAQSPFTFDASRLLGAGQSPLVTMTPGMSEEARDYVIPGSQKPGDAALSCRQLFDEAQALDKEVASQKAATANVMASSQALQQRLIQEAASAPSAGGAANTVAMASSLLGMMPGAGGFAASMAGSVASAALSAATPVPGYSAGTQGQVEKSLAELERAIDVQQLLYVSQARHEHLVKLFLQKNCSVPAGP